MKWTGEQLETFHQILGRLETPNVCSKRRASPTGSHKTGARCGLYAPASDFAR